MNSSWIAASYEIGQMRTAFEDIGTQNPERIWEGLLRLARDYSGATAVQGYTVKGSPGERIAENPTPDEPGLRRAVKCALTTGQRERIRNVFILPIMHGQLVLGVVALEVPCGRIADDRWWRLESVFFFATRHFGNCSAAA